jgi:cation transport ATPase
MDAEAIIQATGRVKIYDPEPLGDLANEPWQVVHELPGRMRLKHPLVRRRRDVCRNIEREAMCVIGVDYCRASPLTGSVLVKFSPRKLPRDQVVGILDSALAQCVVGNPAEIAQTDDADPNLPLCAAAVPLAAVAQFAVPALVPISAGLFIYTAFPSFKRAYQGVVREKRLGADVLDSIVAAGCLATGAVFAGSVISLCLGIGRAATRRTQDSSKRVLLSQLGKVPRSARLCRQTREIETPVNELCLGDVIVVNAGDVVPVDGIVHQGVALLDQHVLTGDVKPAEKGIGDRVFASTSVISGKAWIEVQASGNETISATVGKILERTAGSQLVSQRKREQFADRAVLPTLALAGAALATVGPAGAMAVIYCDLRTGMRLAAPLAMVSSVALCANRGILIKDARALELVSDVDAVLFDSAVLPDSTATSGDFSDFSRVIAELRARGIRHCAVVSSEDQALTAAEVESLGLDECLISVAATDKANAVARWQEAGHKVCFIGDGLRDSPALNAADVGISRRELSSLAADTAQIVFLHDGLEGLCELRDIARDIDSNVNRSWKFVVVPNLLCIAGAFTMGFGVLAALLMNGAGALAAMMNGMLPLRRVAHERLEQALLEELRDMYHLPGEALVRPAGINRAGIESKIIAAERVASTT